MKDGAELVFGDASSGARYVVRCESSAEKRRGDGGGEQQVERKRASAGGPAAVRASHLLVKHCRSRNPSSWKVGCGRSGLVMDGQAKQRRRPALGTHLVRAARLAKSRGWVHPLLSHRPAQGSQLSSPWCLTHSPAAACRRPV
jgi:hypothetical protein